MHILITSVSAMLRSMSELRIDDCVLYFSTQKASQRAHLRYFKVSTEIKIFENFYGVDLPRGIPPTHTRAGRRLRTNHFDLHSKVPT